MQARGPLMIEHRLIERMIGRIEGLLDRIKNSQGVNPISVDTAVDFFRFYADRTHHGKEEDILFRDLDKKELSGEDRRTMKELIDEHVYGRKTTKEIMEANDLYRRGNRAALFEITAGLKRLIEFYPVHIEKEDRHFFPAARRYFSEQEEQEMLEEFRDLDRRIIHEKYKSVVDEFDKLD